MNQRKPNSSLWYKLGLGVLLCMAVLVISTGTTFARYRKERPAEITFAVRENEQIYLGFTQKDDAGNKTFVPAQQLDWETVDGNKRLNLTIANGLSEEEHARQDYKVELRLVGSLGSWKDGKAATVVLHHPSKTEPGKTETTEAMVTTIAEGSILEHTYGPGWVYTFQTTQEEALSWILDGDHFSSVELTVTMGGTGLQQDVSLYPQVIYTTMNH